MPQNISGPEKAWAAPHNKWLRKPGAKLNFNKKTSENTGKGKGKRAQVNPKNIDQQLEGQQKPGRSGKNKYKTI